MNPTLEHKCDQSNIAILPRHLSDIKCELSGIFASNLYRHLKLHETGEIKTKAKIYVCSYCGQTFDNWTKLRRHLCERKLREKYAQTEHFQSGESDNNICQMCDELNEIRLKKKHVFFASKLVQTTSGFSFRCHMCRQEYPSHSGSSLIAHIQDTHFGEKVQKCKNHFCCKFCTARFTLKILCGQHCEVVHKSSPEECKFCHCRFTELSQHILRCWKYYRCEICNSEFPSQVSLFQHVKTHNILFSCNLCKNWQSKYFIDITYHLQSHSKTPKSCEC